jgi:hypothetical protein
VGLTARPQASLAQRQRRTLPARYRSSKTSGRMSRHRRFPCPRQGSEGFAPTTTPPLPVTSHAPSQARRKRKCLSVIAIRSRSASRAHKKTSSASWSGVGLPIAAGPRPPGPRPTGVSAGRKYFHCLQAAAVRT